MMIDFVPECIFLAPSVGRMHISFIYEYINNR